MKWYNFFRGRKYKEIIRDEVSRARNLEGDVQDCADVHDLEDIGKYETEDEEEGDSLVGRVGDYAGRVWRGARREIRKIGKREKLYAKLFLTGLLSWGAIEKGHELFWRRTFAEDYWPAGRYNFQSDEVSRLAFRRKAIADGILGHSPVVITKRGITLSLILPYTAREREEPSHQYPITTRVYLDGKLIWNIDTGIKPNIDHREFAQPPYTQKPIIEAAFEPERTRDGTILGIVNTTCALYSGFFPKKHSFLPYCLRTVGEYMDGKKTRTFAWMFVSHKPLTRAEKQLSDLTLLGNSNVNWRRVVNLAETEMDLEEDKKK